VRTTGGLERVIELVLAVGLAASAMLLVSGLVLGREPLLSLGVVTLMSTPLVRVLVLTVGFVRQRDWVFAAVSACILAVLSCSALLAVRSS
jgi:uncharacterized membrane protein